MNEFCHEKFDFKDKTKKEAYKEFAERLKEKLGDCHTVSDGEYCGFDCGDIHECIDNLVKEMTEVETNQRKEDEEND